MQHARARAMCASQGPRVIRDWQLLHIYTCVSHGDDNNVYPTATTTSMVCTSELRCDRRPSRSGDVCWRRAGQCGRGVARGRRPTADSTPICFPPRSWCPHPEKAPLSKFLESLENVSEMRFENGSQKTSRTVMKPCFEGTSAETRLDNSSSTHFSGPEARFGHACHSNPLRNCSSPCLCRRRTL